MATLHVRNVPDDLYERLRARAGASHRSLSAEVIELLAAGLGPTDRGAQLELVVTRLRELRESLPPSPPGTAAGIIRELRGEG